MIFETERLIIRDYCETDRPFFAAMGGNPDARVYSRGVITRAESDAFIDCQIETLRDIGCGHVVVERKADGAVVGDAGIRPMPADMPFSDDVRFDIGWHLDAPYFNKGYASEAAKGWLGYGFRVLRLEGIFAYAAAINIPSIKVMKRIGMRRDAARDFNHPKLAGGHPLCAQVVYSIRPWQYSA